MNRSGSAYGAGEADVDGPIVDQVGVEEPSAGSSRARALLQFDQPFIGEHCAGGHHEEGAVWNIWGARVKWPYPQLRICTEQFQL